MQVDPLEPVWTAPGTNLLTLEYDEPLSISAFNFHLRRYAKGRDKAVVDALRTCPCPTGSTNASGQPLLEVHLVLFTHHVSGGAEAGAYTRPLFCAT